MNRFCRLSILGLIMLAVSGCGRDTPPPVAPAPDVSDAELQQIEEDEFRNRDEPQQ